MTNLIITVGNYSSGVNNQIYSSGGAYTCNYPVYQGWTQGLTCSIGDTIIIATGGFLDLIAGGFANGNMPAYKYLVCETGQIFELDYIIDDTTAKLKVPSGYNIGGEAAFVVDYLAQPVVNNSFLMDIASGGFGVPAVTTNFVTGTSSLDVSADYDMPVGSEPFLLDINGTGSAQVAINILFESYNT